MRLLKQHVHSTSLLHIKLQCLTDSGENTQGSILLLVSDGQERNSPFIRDVTNDVMAAGVVVWSVAFTEESDIQMVKLAADTGGRSFFYSGRDDSTALVDAFAESSLKSGDTTNALLQVCYVICFVLEIEYFQYLRKI